jgi:dipeptidase D
VIASFLSILLIVATASRADTMEKLPALLQERGAEFVSAARAEDDTVSTVVFQRYVAALVSDLRDNGNRKIAERVVRAFSKSDTMLFSRTDAAWIVHTFASEFYGDDIIRATSRLIRFRTFRGDVPNRLNPAFVQQRQFLDSLARALELNVLDHDGYVQEIWIGEGEETFGLMTHGDVQPVDSSSWSVNPWQGLVRDEKIWGRGAMDDKSPVVAIMYGMRAILDSGLPLRRRVVLLIGSDEESDNTDLDAYLKDNLPPDHTVVVDMRYPVISAEKGWCGARIELPRTTTNSDGRYFQVVRMEAGNSWSVTPGRATAWLTTVGLEPEATGQYLQSLTGNFVHDHPGTNVTVETSGDTVIVVALGRSVRTSVPDEGRNALTDLAVFLDRYAHPFLNEYALMARFLSRDIGYEFDGKTLGIAHVDPFMGSVSVAPCVMTATDSTVMVMYNVRIPRGISTDSLRQALQSAYEQFDRDNGVTLRTHDYCTEPHYVDPSDPFVRDLVRIFNEITGEDRTAGSMSGVTYAHRLPNAVAFGPAMPEDEYTGHTANEYISLPTLVHNIEILTHTMVEFGM